MSHKGCGCTGVLCGGPIPPHPTNGRASEHGNASEMLAAYRAKCPRDKIGKRLYLQEPQGNTSMWAVPLLPITGHKRHSMQEDCTEDTIGGRIWQETHPCEVP